MRYKEKYSIGDMSRICNISKKALRYYDRIGLISSQRQDYNNYRYYTDESLLTVPVIKYYKQMGFRLDEMRAFIEGNVPNVYRAIQNSFLAKIKELEQEQEAIRRKYISVKDWYDLIREAEMVIENNIQEVSVKYVEKTELIFQEQTFDNDIKAAIINIDFTNFLEKQGHEITGPVIIQFSSFKKRMRNEARQIKIMQKTLLPCAKEVREAFGGCMMATCYHIGSHETLGDTYGKICNWARQYGYTLDEESYERYVTDYWTTRNHTQFVTEVMVKVSKKKAFSPAE
ncbi:MAG: MerR family transcriptional regulator [Desulfovibrionaceae bacterium]|nr:MerR family transcriptional regulator [Desulfovibrionaceae bacterium]